MADFNFHFENLKNNNSRKLHDTIDIFNLTQSVTEPTHNQGHQLDLVLSKQSDNIMDSHLTTQLCYASLMYLYPWKSLTPSYTAAPQWGAADAEMKVPSGENTELKRSPFKAWSRSVYSHTCYTYCQGFFSFLLISTLPVHSPAFFPKPLLIFPCVGFG